ncbi:MAG: FtsX-like permease family protein [Bacteroidales bacterium]|jgi:ABC-type lipoprotein release transport system permease subunit|nr:FtsX-like permease family protein [Bacteroidales bacterium]
MSVSFFLARRYLFSKKSKNAINYISGVSVVLVAIVSMSLIIAMSVFNGLTDLVTSLFNSFDPHIKITHSSGRTFNQYEITPLLREQTNIAAFSATLEDDALFVYVTRQVVGRLKGVDSAFASVIAMDSLLFAGDFVLEEDEYDVVFNYVSVGRGVAQELGITLTSSEILQSFAPKRGKPTASLNPMDDFTKVLAYPRSMFSVQMDIDNRYVLSSLAMAQHLFSYDSTQVSSVEIRCANEKKINETAEDLRKVLPQDFVVKTQEEQHEFLYNITQSEKLITFFIISLILIIASFSIVGALTMLIIDKKQDIRILKSMGASQSLIRRIFIFEGWLISVVGAGIGIALGVILCLVQQYFGLLQTGGNFIVDAYPVRLALVDIFYVLAMVLGVGFLAAYLPVYSIIKKHIS